MGRKRSRPDFWEGWEVTMGETVLDGGQRPEDTVSGPFGPRPMVKSLQPDAR